MPGENKECITMMDYGDIETNYSLRGEIWTFAKSSLSCHRQFNFSWEVRGKQIVSLQIRDRNLQYQHKFVEEKCVSREMCIIVASYNN